MTVEDDRRVDEARIRELLEDWVQALPGRDADAIVSRQAPDVVSFDVVNPLQWVGSGETLRRAQEWLSSFQGPVDLEMRELSVTVGDDVAFAYSLNRVSGRMVDGQAIGMWLRSTVCLRKIDGEWTVAPQAQLGAVRRGERQGFARSPALTLASIIRELTSPRTPARDQHRGASRMARRGRLGNGVDTR